MRLKLGGLLFLGLLFPYSVQAQLNSAVRKCVDLAYKGNGQIAKAGHVIEVCLSAADQKGIDPRQKALAFHSAAGALQLLDRREEALRDWATAVRLAPDIEDFHSSYGSLLAEMRRDSAAEAELYAALKLEPADLHALISLRSVLKRNGRIMEAFPLFEIALKRAPNNANLLAEYAVSLMGQKRVAEANSHLDKALLISPSSSLVQDAAGLILTEQREFQKALPHAQKAHLLAPEDPQISLNLAFTAFYAGSFDESLAAFAAAKRVSPHVMDDDSDAREVYRLATREAYRLDRLKAKR